MTTPTLTLTLDQANELYYLATLIEDRSPEAQDAILVLARFLDANSGYPDACIDPAPTSTTQTSAPANQPGQQSRPPKPPGRPRTASTGGWWRDGRADDQG